MRANSYYIYLVMGSLGCRPDIGPELEAQSTPAAVASRPNLMLITVESWRADRLPSANHTRTTMPALSARLSEALLFTNGIAASSWTLPSMASIMTGVMPSEHGLRMPGMTLGIAHQTTSERLTDSGYESAFFGVNPWFVEGFGLERGFDARWNPRPGDSGDHLLRDVEAWLGARSSTAPLFLHLHFFEPHCQYSAPRQVFGFFDDETADLGLQERITNEQYRSMGDCYRIQQLDGSPELDLSIYHRRYDEEVLTTDALIDRALGLADESLGLEEMLVIVTGDHGETFWEHGDFGHGRQLYEESVVVPLVLLGGLAGEARRSEIPVSLIDVHPTLMAAAGLEMDAIRDLRQITETRVVFSETEQDGVHLRAAWLDTRKLLWDWEQQSWQGFDLANDPNESAPVYADLLLKRALRARFDAVEPLPSDVVEDLNLDPVQDEALRSLGYR